MKPFFVTPLRTLLRRAWTLLPWLAWPAMAQTPAAPRPQPASPVAQSSPATPEPTAAPVIEILPPPGAAAGQAPVVIQPPTVAPTVVPAAPSVASPAGSAGQETIEAPSADQRLQSARQAQSLRQYERAAALLRLCADQGNSDCQRDLGNAYRLGQGVAVDAKLALVWFEKAATQGHAAAQNNLGLMLKNGQGQPRNVDQAAQWFSQSAAQGHAAGQNNYALMLQDGLGVPADWAAAAQWFEKAAAQGDPYASRNLQALKRRPGWAARASQATDSEAARQDLTQSLTQAPASTRAQATYTQRKPLINAAPLGLEVGFARWTDVQKAWAGKVDLTQEAIDPRSGGPRVSVPGSALGISGLQSAVLLFDQRQVLSGVVLHMLKKPFGANEDTWAQQTLRALQLKYRAIEQHVPPSGDTWARFRQGDSRIDFWLPETSFQMTVYYLSDALNAAWPVADRLRTGQDDGRGLAKVL